MSQLSIGIIETIGLAAAIEAADVCVKSANVNLIGYELTKGNGMVVVKIEGNVGAVKAAIEASKVAAAKVSSVYSTKIIPRPSDSIECLIKNENTVGCKVYDKNQTIEQEIDKLEELNIKDVSENEVETSDVDDTINHSNLDTAQLDDKDIDTDTDTDYEIKKEKEQDESIEEKQEENIDEDDDSNKGYTCNLCKDPKCPRQKGDFKVDCIHYDERKDN